MLLFAHRVQHEFAVAGALFLLALAAFFFALFRQSLFCFVLLTLPFKPLPLRLRLSLPFQLLAGLTFRLLLPRLLFLLRPPLLREV